MTDAFRAGDVVWAPDPFRDRSNPRLWLVLAADALPYPGEEYLCAVLTTSDLPANHEIGDDWVTGRDPAKTSFCSPWVLATVKHGAIANPQGRVTGAFTDEMRQEGASYLRG